MQIAVDRGILSKDFETLPGGIEPFRPGSQLAGAFSVRYPERLYGRKVLIIDDVFTTGSTLAAVAAVILQGGADRVFGLSAASVRFLNNDSNLSANPLTGFFCFLKFFFLKKEKSAAGALTTGLPATE